MVTLTKIIGTPTSKSTPQSLQTVGTYLYYTGADTSNVATVAALLSSISTIISEESQMWFGKPKPYHVSHASYSAYNAFRKLDITVNVAFPGSVSWEAVDAFDNHATGDMLSQSDADEMWLEVYVSSIVRTLITADDDGDFAAIVEIRKINPFLDHKNSISQFLHGFEILYAQGDQLGCNELAQYPSRLNNYLVDAFFKCITLTGYYDQSLEVLYRLEKKFPEVCALVAKTLFLANRELEAVKFIHDKLSSSTHVAEISGASQLLLLQSQYCFKKKRFDLALPLAIKAVESAPSSFEPWSHLVKVYIAMAKYEEALLSLNACPMVTHKEKYIFKRIATGASDEKQSHTPDTSDMHLPLPDDVFLKGVTDLSSLEVANEHAKLAKAAPKSNGNEDVFNPQSLLTLPASNLKSTFREAYSMLAEIVHKLGWETMLQTRAKVFVMEEEWRKTTSSVNIPSPESDVSPDGEIRKKRLCERWLDNLFMLLYEDMKAYTYCRAEELQAESMTDSLPKSNTDLGLWGKLNDEKASVDPYTESRSCLEWELIGLVSERLGHTRDAQRCFERALSRRFSVRAARKLIEIYSNWRKRAKAQIQTQNRDPTKYDTALLRLCVGLLVWDYRWYTLFSPILLNTLAETVNDIGATKTESEVRVWFDDLHGNKGIYDLVNFTITVLENWGRLEVEK